MREVLLLLFLPPLSAVFLHAATVRSKNFSFSDKDRLRAVHTHTHILGSSSNNNVYTQHHFVM